MTSLLPQRPFLWQRCAFGLYTNDSRCPQMNSPSLTPFFDGHNDALLRLYKRKGPDAPRAFLDGEGKGQLDLPMAIQGGFAGGLFAIFVPSPKNQVPTADNAPPVSGTAPGAPMPPPLDLT